MRKAIVIIIAIGLLLLFFFNFYVFLKKKVLTSEFKQRTEKKLGEVLQAHVKIGKIRFGLLKHISLSGLQINQDKSKLPVRIGIEKIIIKYDLLDFLKQKFRIPAEVILDSPKISFQSLISPFSASTFLGTQPKASFFRRVELGNGKLRFPGFQRIFEIEKIRGKAALGLGGVFNVDFKGEAAGIARGSLHLHGALGPRKNEGHLNLRFQDINFLSSSNLPLTEVNGFVEISESKIIFRGFTFKLRDLPVEFSGDIEEPFTTNSKWHLLWKVAQDKITFSTEVQVDNRDQSIEGKLDLFGTFLEFNGSMTSDSTGFQLHNVMFNNGYEGYGAFRWDDGHYLVQAEKGEQRFSMDLNLRDLNVDLNFNAHHLQAFNHDLTTYASLHLSPIEPEWRIGNYRFQTALKTSYFIVDFHPLHDFKADFEISELGVHSLIARWGSSSNLKGAFSFGEAPSLDCTLLISDFKLPELKFLGLHPMPISFEGMLEGKIRMMGDVKKPDVSGQLMIHDGKIGNFKYDEAIVEFYGQPPYLRLLDSKITRKDNTFLIKGDIDFELENIFQKVKIVSLDQIIIWKGLDIAREIETRARSQGGSLGRANILAPINAGASGSATARVEAEYALAGGKSLKVTAEEEENGRQAVTVGPKLRF